MPNLLQRQPIGRQTAILGALLLLPIVAGAAWSSNRTRFERAAEVRQEAASLAATSAAYFDQYLAGVDSMASALVRDPFVVARERPGADRLFAAVLADHPLILNILLSDPDGAIRGSGIRDAGPRLIVNMPHIQQVLTTGKSAMSELSVGPRTHKPTIMLGYPVRAADGMVNGVLSVGLDLSHLESTFAAIPLADGSTVTLTNRAGLVLARNRDSERYIGTTIELPETPAPGDDPRASRRVDSDGVQRLHASARLTRGPWVMSVGIPTRVVLARLWPLWRRQLIIVAIGTLSSLFLWLWMGSHMSRQLNHLRSAAQRIAQGDLSPVPAGPSLNMELAQLQGSFVTMAGNLRETREELARQIEQERKVRAMLETLQSQIVRQERLAAVGLLVSGVAHELNNPLQAIMGAAELLERRPEISDEGMQEIALVKTQSHRASEIIRNLSRFGSQQSAPPSIVDLKDVVSEVVQLRRADFDLAQITCETETVSTGQVFANFTEIEQVVLNFVINAQHALQGAHVPDARVLIRSYDVGPRIRLEVIDNGPGVPTDNEQKLFQPFFTTKPVGQGTGLGLSVSYGIIESYGGTIGYRGNDGGGAMFFFELPRV